MSKALLLSFIFATLAIPARAAREPNPRKGLRKMITNMLLFNAFYAFALIYLWGRC